MPVDTPIPTPPRPTGDTQKDIAALFAALNEQHKALVVESKLADPAFQGTAETIDTANLPDPANTSIATAQATANEALRRTGIGTVASPAVRRFLRMVPDIFDFTAGNVAVDDYTDALNAMEVAAFNNEIRTCYFPYGVTYTVHGPKIVIRSGLVVHGDHSTQSQLVFTDLTGGLFWDAENFGGGGIEKIGLVGKFAGAANGDYLLRVGGGVATNSPNQFVAKDVLITSTLGTMSYGILADGTAFPGASGGLRVPIFDDIKIFNTTVIAFDNRYVRSGMYSNINIFQGGGNNETLNFTGLADISGETRTTVGVALANIRCNDLIFDWATDIAGAPVSVETNVSCSANTSNLNLFGRIASFTNSGGATNVVFNPATQAFTNVSF